MLLEKCHKCVIFEYDNLFIAGEVLSFCYSVFVDFDGTFISRCKYRQQTRLNKFGTLRI